MNNKEKQIKVWGVTTIFISILVIIPSITLLFNMLTGASKQLQYGYSVYAFALVLLGSIPSLISIVFGIITYSIYHKNRQLLYTTNMQLYYNRKKLALFALLLSISSAVLIILDLFLDTFVFQ